MKNLFSKKNLNTFILFVGILLFVKILWLIVTMLWLPVKGINYNEEKGGNALFYRVKLSPNKAPAPKIIKKTKMPIIRSNIKELKLIAIYNAMDITVVTIEYQGRTHILSKGDVLNGFTLESAGEDYANLSKSSKLYKLYLTVMKDNHTRIRSIPQRRTVKAKPDDSFIGEVIDAGDHKIVEKSLVKHFANNLDEINKNIGIAEVRDKNGLKGFQISFIRRGSPFAQLGVKRGDIIKTINGQKINSYNAAFSVYKNIGNIENLSMVIERGNEEMELEYEVD